MTRVLADLDRCPHGRHSIDPCTFCPDGMSAGNPYLRPGQIIGYGLDGILIVVPERDRLRDSEAWYRWP